MSDGFNWGLTPSGNKDEPAEKPEAPAENAPRPKNPVDAGDDLPPTEAMPTPMRPYRREPGPAEPPAEPFVPSKPFWIPSEDDVPAPTVEPTTEKVVRPPVPYPRQAPAPSTESIRLDEVFGEGAFREYEDAPLLAQVPLRRDGRAEATRGDARRPQAAARRAAPPRAVVPRDPLTQGQRVLLIIAIALVAVIVLILVFLAGMRLPGLAPQAAPTAATSAPTPEPVTTTAAPAVGPLAAGDYAWDALLGGECISPFTSAWEDTYTVVDCAGEHDAQLVTHAALDDDAFPGAEAIAGEVAPLCASAKVIDYTAASAYNDLQVLASYPTTDAEWAAGYRSYYCFAVRAGGPLTGSIAKPVSAATMAPAP